MAVGIKDVSIQDVDREVARFWNTECDEDSYSSYIKKEDYMTDGKLNEFKYISAKISSSWFEVLAYQIEKSKGAITDWDTAFNALIDNLMTFDSVKKRNYTREDVIQLYQPYKDLVEHFKSLGWVPFYSYN